MAYPDPKDPIGGDAGWVSSGYQNFLVTYTSRQGTPMQCLYFASSAAEAIQFLNNDVGKANLFGPYTNVNAVAAPTATGAGD